MSKTPNKYRAQCEAGDSTILFSFAVDGEEGSEKIVEIEPPFYRDLLTGQALLAHQNYRNLLKGNLEGIVSVPTKVIYKF